MNAIKPVRNMFPVLLGIIESLGVGEKVDVDEDFSICYTQAVVGYTTIKMMVKVLHIGDITRDSTEVYFFEPDELKKLDDSNSLRQIKDQCFLSLRATVTNGGEIVFKFKQDEFRFHNPEVILFTGNTLAKVLEVQRV